MTLLALILLAASAAFADARKASLKTVDLGYAKYQSDVSLAEGVTSFLGVRYAAPPIGASYLLPFQIMNTDVYIRRSTFPRTSSAILCKRNAERHSTARPVLAGCWGGSDGF